MNPEERVFIAGAGPVGLTAAADLVRRGVPVTVFEAAPGLSEESRASTFHPSTLDMLDEQGFAGDLIAQGLVAPTIQYRSKREVIAAFDFSAISDLTRHPYRLQAEQFKLTRIICAKLAGHPHFSVEFGRRLVGVSQDAGSVTVELEGVNGREQRCARWLIGADGASSRVRRALDLAFEGFTWPERFLVVGTPFDFDAVIDDLASVTYVADPTQWHFLLRIPQIWRVMFPVPPGVSDEDAVGPAFVQASLDGVVTDKGVAPGVTRDDIVHLTLYRVHQRVAATFRAGRVFLAGDAAHVNNPLGGMGMNGGIHDALNLAERLARVWRNEAPEAELDRYDRQRRGVTLEYVQQHTIRNKRNLEARDPAEQARFRDDMRRIAENPDLTRDYLARVGMIASLARAAELG
jgi:2-polyprenyl-6-methoxyphenol hydroxylase-like FAD-dependent oxidoreductase